MSIDCVKGRIHDDHGYDRGICGICKGAGCSMTTTPTAKGEGEMMIATVGLMGDNYVIMLAPPLRQIVATEDEAKSIRNYLVALLGAPTDEEIGALG